MPGPIAPENNPVINPQYFQPSRFSLQSISQGVTTTVTMYPTTIRGFTVLPNYVIGQKVRFIMTPQSRMGQINNQEAYVIDVPSDVSVVVDIDSRFFDSFVSGQGNTPAQIIAIGDVNSGQINSSGLINNITYINGSFINISPN